MGYLLLEGGAEFGGAMSEPDRRAIQLAGGPNAPLAILPTAAAPDNNQDRAGRNALNWFRSLGAARAEIIPILDHASAADPVLAERLRTARLIYMLGGFPAYLAETLSDSLAWEAAMEAFAGGAVLGGSSAGAMVLCEHFFDPEAGRVRRGLNVLGNACVLPHHRSFGHKWAPRLIEELPHVILLGIDERTGILNDGADSWSVYGAGQLTLYRRGQSERYSRGASFSIG